MTDHPGFTLVELMIATAITCLIAAGTFLFFSGSKTLSKDAYGEVTRALTARIDREKSLFVEARLQVDVRLPGSNLWEEVRR